MKRHFESFAYILNLPEDIKMHFLLNTAVKDYLLMFKKEITQENFYDYVEEAVMIFMRIMHNNLKRQ